MVYLIYHIFQKFLQKNIILEFNQLINYKIDNEKQWIGNFAKISTFY